MKFFIAFLLLVAAIAFIVFFVAALEHLRKVDLGYLKPKIDRMKILSRVLRKGTR